MKRMKILMLTRLFPSREFPAFGTFCLERAKALAQHADVRVMVPTPYFPGWLPGRASWKRWSKVERHGEILPGIKVSYPRYLSIPATATWLQGTAMARSVMQDLASFEDGWLPDVIDGHFAFPDGYAATKLAKSLRLPCVITCHGSDLREYPSIPIAGNMTRWALSNADRVISVSSYLLQRSVELGCRQEHAVFLTNGVDPAKFSVRAQAECRERLGLPLERKIGVYVGYLIDRKDQSLILRAVHDIRTRGAQPPLIVLVGDGPNRQKIEREISEMNIADDVVLAGQQSHAEVAYWMGAADWLLLSSSYEGWATVYFEAMACGRPVITSNVSSASDAINDAAYGKVVEPRTAEAFATAIMDAMRHDYDPTAIRAYAEAHSWNNWAAKAMQIFADAIGPR